MDLLSRRITVRLTEKEYEKLMLQRDLSGYRSISIYIRDVLFSTRIQRRNYSKTDANLARQVTMLRSELRRIGINYNQRVKALNTLTKLRDKKGNLIINMRDIDRDTLEMKRMMEEMVKMVNELYSRVMETDSPESGDSNNSSLTSK